MQFNEPEDALSISSGDEDSDNVEPERKKQCKEFKKEDYENYQLTDINFDGNIVTPLRILDYRMLNSQKFINDKIIEFYLNYWLCRKLSLEDRTRTYLFNPFFYTSLSNKKITKSRHERVKKWTKKVNIFEKDFIFIPINENHHWFMAVICYAHLTGPVNYLDGTQLKTLYEDDFGDYERPSPKPCQPNPEKDEADGNTEDLRYYPDFSHDANNDGNYNTDVENLKKKNRIPIKQPVILIFDSLNKYGNTSRARIVATLREWLSEEFRTIHNGAPKDFSPMSMKGTVVRVPQQPNTTDCGLFVMHYFEKFFECPIVDFTCPILHLENWFPINEVSNNCKKRREVASIIVGVMNEQGRSLPLGFSLPQLSFLHQEQQPQNSLVQPLLSHRYVQHHQQHYNNNNPVEDDMMESDDVDEEELAEWEGDDVLDEENLDDIDEDINEEEIDDEDEYDERDEELPDEENLEVIDEDIDEGEIDEEEYDEENFDDIEEDIDEEGEIEEDEYDDVEEIAYDIDERDEEEDVDEEEEDSYDE